MMNGTGHILLEILRKYTLHYNRSIRPLKGHSNFHMHHDIFDSWFHPNSSEENKGKQMIQEVQGGLSYHTDTEQRVGGLSSKRSSCDLGLQNMNLMEILGCKSRVKECLQYAEI